MSKNANKDNFTKPDYYGQVHPVENADMIQQGLSNLEKELSQIPEEKKKTFLEALEKCPDIVNESHKLMFLRCEVFNADVSAFILTILHAYM